MQSGVTGINTIRIYSPIKQTHDHDADGTFIRRWVPEIASLPNEHLAEPWHTPSLTQHMARCVIGESYPHPIVDHTTAYKEAQRRIFEARDTALAKRTSAAVFQKHGSRKNDRR
jgi:deoxyribodipyrimidine photo-lyase